MSSVLIFRSAALFSFTCLLFVLNPVLAQTPDISTEHVIIDLSVINNPEPKTSLPYYKNSQKLRPKLDLLLPGFSAPISMLHISVPKTSNHIKLKIRKVI